MLKKRLITGSVLVLLGIVIVFFLPKIPFLVVTTLIILLAGWEWSLLAGLESTLSRLGFLLLLLVCMWLVNMIVPLMTLLLLTMLFWLYALYLVSLYPRGVRQWSSKLVRVLMGLIVLIPCWLSVNYIRIEVGNKWLLFLMLTLVWAADIGAYFAGRRWGKQKLMAMVSPGKTWQGCLGGLVLSLLVGWIGLFFGKVPLLDWLPISLLIVLLNVFAVTGDLFESMLKRHVDMKDSSGILPGHGGVLDRLDSLTAAAPLFLLGFLLYWY